jgi:hypothetical protein
MRTAKPGAPAAAPAAADERTERPFAMGFSLFVEVLNHRLRQRRFEPVVLNKPQV